VHEHFPQNEENLTETCGGKKKKKKRLKNEMKCSHSSTLVLNIARLVGLRSWKGSFKKKKKISHCSEC